MRLSIIEKMRYYSQTHGWDYILKSWIIIETLHGSAYKPCMKHIPSSHDTDDNVSVRGQIQSGTTRVVLHRYNNTSNMWTNYSAFVLTSTE